MLVEIFSICDAATSEGGKLNILGAFDAIHVRQFPGVLAHCALAIRLRFFTAERADHTVTVRFIDADGKNVLPPAGGGLKVAFPEGQRSASFNLVLNIPGLKFEHPGDHSLELLVDGEGIASLPLEVKATL